MKKQLLTIFLLCIIGLQSNIITHVMADTSNSLGLDDTTIVLVSDDDPYYAILGASISCFYDDLNKSTIYPLLICEKPSLTSRQQKFIDRFSPSQINITCIGEHISTGYNSLDFIGTPSDISLDLLTYYKNCTKALILPYGNVFNYQLAITATPIASYSHIPIIIYNNNSDEIEDALVNRGIKDIILIGDNEIHFKENLNTINLDTIDQIQEYTLSLIKEKFNEMNYIVLTNPSDVKDIEKKSVISQNKNIHINTTQLTIFGKTFTIQGSPDKQLSFSVPNGLYHLNIYANITKYNKFLFSDKINPYMKLTVKDSQDNIIAYAPTNSHDIERIYVDSLICNQSGNYSISLETFHGFKGGFFSVRGFSKVDFAINISIQLAALASPHFPRVLSLSSLSPYIASVHGGIVVSNASFSPFSEGYESIANGYATGPWYEKNLHEYNNRKVNDMVTYLKKQLNIIDKQGLLTRYLDGPAWLGILGDTNMIPMYYYSPSQPGIPEKGLPSDNPYMINDSLSIGRIIAYNLSDTSLLLCRTYFYENLCKSEDVASSSLQKFDFMYGEGFGETGGFFHQIPYANKVQTFGFDTAVYGILKNSRQFADAENVFTGANYNEYLGHADWFWFSPSLYGFDMYNKVFDVAHLKNWQFTMPSIFLTSACLMGRIDGLYPCMNIGITLLHAGCNGFVGATRETGQEAGLETFENHLIIDNYSMGEALRGEKQVDKELPTYYVRTLYGDPAFNPFEPNNGFSNQGRPN